STTSSASGDCRCASRSAVNNSASRFRSLWWYRKNMPSTAVLQMGFSLSGLRVLSRCACVAAAQPWQGRSALQDVRKVARARLQGSYDGLRIDAVQRDDADRTLAWLLLPGQGDGAGHTAGPGL